MLEEDLDDAWQEIESIRKSDGNDWRFIFNAKDHELAETSNDLEDFRLSGNELESLGKQVTQLRQQVSARVGAIKAIGDAGDIPEIPPEIDFRALAATFKSRQSKYLAKREDCQEAGERGLSHKYRRRRYCDLSANDLIGIAHAVHIQHRFYRDIAEEFLVSISLVSRIARKKGFEFLKEKMEKIDKEREDERAVGNAIDDFLPKNGCIGSVATVLRQVQISSHNNLSLRQTRQIMVDKLSLKFN